MIDTPFACFRPEILRPRGDRMYEGVHQNLHQMLVFCRICGKLKQMVEGLEPDRILPIL